MLLDVYKRSFKDDFIKSFKAASPIVLGYIPLGLASGILSQKAGLTPLQIGVLSLFAYAGSGQFITASMIMANASILSITLTNFIVNSRSILMSSALAPFFKGTSKKFLIPFSHGITDETFAINFIKLKDGNWSNRNAILVNLISHISWISSNILGGITGTVIDIDTVIINFILTSMFICLLILQIKNKLHILAAIISGVAALSLSMLIKNNLYIIFATLIGATICFLIEKSFKKGRKN